MNPFFDNYRGRYSQFWVRQFGLIPELPTHFDNAQSMYELVAWLQRAVKTLLDDFQALEMEMDDFKQAVIDLLEKLIPNLIQSYIHSKEFKDYLKDLLQTEEFKELLKQLIKEVMQDPDMKEWFKEYLKENLKELINDPEFKEIIKNIIDSVIKDTDFYKNLMKQLACINDKVNSVIAYLRKQVTDRIKSEFSVIGKTAGKAIMEAKKVNSNGFQFHFTTTNIAGEVKYGDGYVEGYVNHSYRSNPNGSIMVDIKSVTFTSIKWNMIRANDTGENGLSLVIRDNSGHEYYKRNYNALASWVDNTQRTMPINKTIELKPHETTDNIQLFEIWDNWFVDTQGFAYLKYFNDNDAFALDESTCGLG